MEDRRSELERILAGLRGVREDGAGRYMALCPAHDDHDPSLQVTEGDGGRILLHCFAGCTYAAIRDALGLEAPQQRDNGRQPRHIVATYDYHDESGTLAFQVVRYDPKDFRQRRPDGQGGWSWSTRGIRKMLYRLPALLADHGRTVYVCEGEKDADRLTAEGLLATCSPQGAGKWRPEYAETLEGCAVVILPDNDAPGQTHARDVAASLQSVAATVKILALPGLPEKGDASTWLDMGHTAAELEALAAGAPEAAETPDRPRLDAGAQDLAEITPDAWRALESGNDPPALFTHGGRPVRLEHGEPAPLLAELTPDRLRYEMARAARWYNRRKVNGLWEEVAGKPPLDVVRNMLATPAELVPLPPVDRIVRSPVFAQDGQLLRQSGYHAAARVILCLDDDLRIPEIADAPTRSDVAAAVATIDDLLADFPFCSDADRAHAFALLLAPLVRDMIPGPTPMHLVESATPGSGKGLLASVLLTPALGDDVASMAAGRDDDEWRKRLTAALRYGRPAILIDNVRASVDAAPLALALTQPLWVDRLLGASEELTLPIRCVWVTTGNNPMLSTEIARRSIRIRLDPKIDQPWRRDASGFRHPHLLAWARAHRGELLGAGLTLAQAWISAGQPAAKTPPLGSYEDWARVIGGILAFAGIPGFLQNLDELYERADGEGAAWRRFIGAWWEAHGETPVGVADLYPIALEIEELPLGSGQERAQKTRLGRGLKAKEDVVLGGFRIESAGTYKNAAQYQLRRTLTNQVGEPGEPGEPFHSTRHDESAQTARGGEANQVNHVNQAPALTPTQRAYVEDIDNGELESWDPDAFGDSL